MLSIGIIYNHFKNETVYVLKEYNKDGQLLGTNEYVIRGGDTIMHGKFVNYNNRGIKISEGHFFEDEPYGECIYYNEDGNKEVVQFRKNSTLTLESTYYNPKGYIEKYIVFDDLGHSSFIITYDEKGVIRYDGYPQIEIYQYKFANKSKVNIKKEQNLKVGDTLKYSYIVANIPNATRSFEIENLNVPNSEVTRTLKNVPPAQIYVKEVLVKKGKNSIRSIVKYEFKDQVTPVFIDTISFDINVN